MQCMVDMHVVLTSRVVLLHADGAAESSNRHFIGQVLCSLRQAWHILIPSLFFPHILPLQCIRELLNLQPGGMLVTLLLLCSGMSKRTTYSQCCKCICMPLTVAQV